MTDKTFLEGKVTLFYSSADWCCIATKGILYDLEQMESL